MKVWVQTLGAHLGHLVHVVGHHLLQELLQVAPRVDALQLFLVQVEHLVDTSFELELKIKFFRYGHIKIDSV